MNAFLIFSLIFLVVIGNILWYWLKFNLKEKGYKTRYFYGHLKDLKNASDVINTTDDPHTKKIFRVVLYLLVVIIIMIPTIFFLNISSLKIPSIQSQRCEMFNDYITYHVEGTVESKFIDKPNHALETLNLSNGKLESSLPVLVSNLYEFLQSGDSIRKVKGDSELTVYRNGNKRVFNVLRTDWCND